jgi:Spy/CpxP family protein refolding chaperone
MKEKSRFQIGALMVILAVFLLVPRLVQAQEIQMENYLKEFKENVFKQLNLTPEKEKAFRAIGDKKAAERQKILARLKDAQKQLEDMVAANKPENKAKINSLVRVITESQDKLFASYRTQRNEELALLTPEQKAKYLVTMINWRQELMQKAMHGQGGTGMGQTPPAMPSRPMGEGGKMGQMPPTTPFAPATPSTPGTPSAPTQPAPVPPEQTPKQK